MPFRLYFTRYRERSCVGTPFTSFFAICVKPVAHYPTGGLRTGFLLKHALSLTVENVMRCTCVYGVFGTLSELAQQVCASALVLVGGRGCLRSAGGHAWLKRPLNAGAVRTACTGKRGHVDRLGRYFPFPSRAVCIALTFSAAAASSPIRVASCKMIAAIAVCLVSLAAVWIARVYFGKRLPDRSGRRPASPPRREGEELKAQTAAGTPQAKEPVPRGAPAKSSSPAADASKKRSPQPPCTGASHPLYLGLLKPMNHALSAIAVDGAGTRVLCASTDSMVRLYTLPSVTPLLQHAVEKEARYAQGAIPADSLTAIDFAYGRDDCVFGATELAGTLVKLSVEFGPQGQPRALRQVGEASGSNIHRNRIRWLYSSKGPWIVTASEGNDTEIGIFSYAFSPLMRLDTKQVTNFQLAVSPRTGRFFAAAAWVSGIKIHEILTHNNNISKCDKAMDVPTSCGTTAVAFSPDDTRVVVATKDGTLHLYNVNVRYQAGEDPKLLRSVPCNPTQHQNDPTSHHPPNTNPTPAKTRPSFDQLMFAGADGRYVIGASGRTIVVMESNTLQVVSTIADAHATPISVLVTSPSADWFATTSAGNRTPTIWRLPTPGTTPRD